MENNDNAFGKNFLSAIPTLLVFAGFIMQAGVLWQKMEDNTRRITNLEISRNVDNAAASVDGRKLAELDAKLTTVIQMLDNRKGH